MSFTVLLYNVNGSNGFLNVSQRTAYHSCASCASNLHQSLLLAALYGHMSRNGLLKQKQRVAITFQTVG